MILQSFQLYTYYYYYPHLQTWQYNMDKNKKTIDQIPIPNTCPLITQQQLESAKTIYVGDYCDVLCVQKVDRKYAIKAIYTDRINTDRLTEQMNQIYLQITTLYSIKHPGIIQLLGHFLRDGIIGLIFPLFGRTISQFIRDRKKKLKTNKTFLLNDFIKVLRGIGSAIFQLYNMGLAHRDISQDNILIDENYNTKLIDLGFLGNIQSCKGRLGTREYFAPEIISGQSYNHKVDVWSFGILLYKLLYGILLFKPKAKNLSEQELDIQYLKNMKQPIQDFPDDKLLLDEKPSDEILSYIKSMLNFNPDKRPEIGYLLSKKIFGAEEREGATYTIKEFVRQKTFRKSNKAQGVMHSNVKQMSIAQLQSTIFQLALLKITELNRLQELSAILASEQSKYQKLRYP